MEPFEEIDYKRDIEEIVARIKLLKAEHYPGQKVQIQIMSNIKGELVWMITNFTDRSTTKLQF